MKRHRFGAYYDIVSAGITETNRVLETSNTANRLAVAGNIALADSTSLLLTGSRLYSAELENQADLADRILQLVASGRVTGGGIAVPLARILPTAQQGRGFH